MQKKNLIGLMQLKGNSLSMPTLNICNNSQFNLMLYQFNKICEFLRFFERHNASNKLQFLRR